MLPKNWLVKQEDTERFKNSVIEYINTTYNKVYRGDAFTAYYGVIGGVCETYYNKDLTGKYELSLNEFIHMLKENEEPIFLTTI